MSKIVKIIDGYPSERVAGNIVYEFIDDLNRVYSLDFGAGEVWLYYQYCDDRSELDEYEISQWMKNMQARWDNLPDQVLRYMQASFMEWRDVVELENAN